MRFNKLFCIRLTVCRFIIRDLVLGTPGNAQTPELLKIVSRRSKSNMFKKCWTMRSQGNQILSFSGGVNRHKRP